MSASPIAAIEGALASGKPFDAVCQDGCRQLRAGVKHYNVLDRLAGTLGALASGEAEGRVERLYRPS